MYLVGAYFARPKLEVVAYMYLMLQSRPWGKSILHFSWVVVFHKSLEQSTVGTVDFSGSYNPEEELGALA